MEQVQVFVNFNNNNNNNMLSLLDNVDVLCLNFYFILPDQSDSGDIQINGTLDQTFFCFIFVRGPTT